jgi:hypothetical protein
LGATAAALVSVVGGGGGVGGGATESGAAAGLAAAPGVGAAGFVPIKPLNQPNNPPDCFLVPVLALRLCLPLRVTLDLCLDMIIMNNYILNEDINI